MSAASTPKTPTPPTLPPGVTKTCHIVKRPDFDGYGFNLHSEKVKPGQFIGKVDAASPAEAAGLKEGDRILEVNGVSIGSETHKQVVARIKAIANEVRLLLIDVDGKALATPPKSASPLPSPVTNGSTGSNSPPCYEGTTQELPGASANISSISVTSTKRMSNASSTQSGSTMNVSDMDVVDRGMPPVVAAPIVIAPIPAQNGNKSPTSNSSNIINNNNNNNSNSKMMMNTPPPPSATVANKNNNGSVYSSNNTTATAKNNSNNTNTTNGNVNGNGIAATPITPTVPTTTATITTTATTAATNGGMNRAGSLNLPLTVAEMRAKLASKKKYDPKNESVDLKKKFEIIQKL